MCDLYQRLTYNRTMTVSMISSALDRKETCKFAYYAQKDLYSLPCYCRYVSINLGGNPPQFKSLGGTVSEILQQIEAHTNKTAYSILLTQRDIHRLMFNLVVCWPSLWLKERLCN
jgi:hypothetical protein